MSVKRKALAVIKLHYVPDFPRYLQFLQGSKKTSEILPKKFVSKVTIMLVHLVSLKNFGNIVQSLAEPSKLAIFKLFKSSCRHKIILDIYFL